MPVFGSVLGIKILLLLAFSLGSIDGEAKVFHVYKRNSGTSGTGADGLTWDTAFADITSAVAVATKGDEIWVASGVYHQINAIALPGGVAIYGGFSGAEASLAQRNWSVNQTVLAGAQKASVIKITQGGEGTRIDGLIITGGKAENGGGICSSSGAVAIVNNRIYGNVASGNGAGISCTSFSGVISNNIVVGNGTNQTTSTFLVGGGIYVSGGSASIVNNLIAGNMATVGGGVAVNQAGEGTPLLAYNVIAGNSSTIEGGGAESWGLIRIVSNKIINNTITPLQSNILYGGAGLSIVRATNSLLANNLIQGNRMTASAKLQGSGVLIDAASVVTAVNNTVLYNSGGSGACFVMAPSAAGNESVAANNLFAFNDAGLELNDKVAFSFNCIFANGTNDFIGLPSPVGSNGNIAADPMLLQASNSITALLSPASPCRDKGGNDLAVTGFTDVFNQTRMAEGQVDIGAQEIAAGAELDRTRIVRVSLEGNDENDGSTWALARKSVQSAIDSLAASGGEIWVMEGRYDERIYPDMFVQLYGGFAGSETARDQRDWLRHSTVLDGRKEGTVVSIFGAGSNCIIDGFTIANGDGGLGYGGGVLVDSCSPRIANNLITGNTAYSGGGVSIINNSAAVVEGNRIMRNTAVRLVATTGTGSISIRGGGVHIYANPVIPNVVVRNNLIADNRASGIGLPVRAGYGGGIYCCGNAQILNNTFLRNYSLYDGTNSTASSNGGQLYWEFGKLTSPTNAIVNNVFSDMNSGVSFGLMQAGSLDFRQNIFNGTNAALFVVPASYFTPGTFIVADPMLSETDGMPVPLRGSPCIDAGDNSVVGSAAFDLTGNARVSNGVVDLGAFEYRAAEIRLQSVRETPDGLFHCELSGLPGADYVLQTTVDFKNWDNIATNKNSTIEIPMEKAVQTSRFFRAVQYR